MEPRLEHLPSAVVRERMTAGARSAILPVGALEAHAGTVGVGSRSFRRFAGDVLESLARGGFRKILILNGHGGQIEELKDAAYQTFHRTGTK